MEDTISRRRAIKGIGAAVITAGLAGCGSSEGEQDSAGGSSGGGSNDDDEDSAGGSNDSTPEPTPEPTTESGPKAEIVEHSAYEDEFESGVEGVVQNNTDEAIEYLEIEAKFFDEEGTRVGDNFTNVEDLGANKKWQFELMFLGDDGFAEYELTLTTEAL